MHIKYTPQNTTRKLFFAVKETTITCRDKELRNKRRRQSTDNKRCVLTNLDAWIRSDSHYSGEDEAAVVVMLCSSSQHF